MTDKAKQFLASCNAPMEITFVGKAIPAPWKDATKPHHNHQFTITTPKGSYTSYFWDSLYNTELSEMNIQRYAEKKYKIHWYDVSAFEKGKAIRELDAIKAEAKPTEYSILACMEKYGYDSFSDFCSEFGYSTDSISAREIFLACGEEYAGLRRIFTEEQMEQLREIW